MLTCKCLQTYEYVLLYQRNNNISYIEEQVGYLPVYRGIWDDELRYILFMKYMNLTKHSDLNFIDILGYVDSDIECAIRKGLIR